MQLEWQYCTSGSETLDCSPTGLSNTPSLQLALSSSYPLAFLSPECDRKMSAYRRSYHLPKLVLWNANIILIMQSRVKVSLDALGNTEYY